MAIEYTQNTFGSAKGILAFPDHYVAYAQMFEKEDSAATTVGGKKIVRAGTIYPANDTTAIGIVMYDVDVTNGDGHGAIILHGFIKTGALPVIPSANAVAALKGIQFIPAFTVTVTFSAVKAKLTVGDAKDTVVTATITASGDTFRDAAATLTNWTIAGEDDAKVAVTNIEVSADRKSVTVTMKTSALAVAGNVTMVPKVDAMTLGVTSQTAATVCTVAAGA